MLELEWEAWKTFKNIASQHTEYEEIVITMLREFKELGYHIRLKVHFLRSSHLDYLPEDF